MVEIHVYTTYKKGDFRDGLWNYVTHINGCNHYGKRLHKCGNITIFPGFKQNMFHGEMPLFYPHQSRLVSKVYPTWN